MVFLKVPILRFYILQGSGYVNYMQGLLVLLELDFFPQT
jgi:hypothetical protein